jgi:hypothetical protein
MPAPWHSKAAAAAVVWLVFGAPLAVQAGTPNWLVTRPGQTGLVGAAPWPMTEPEAALTGSDRTAAIDPDDAAQRPDDAVHEPIGLRVVIDQLYSDGVALVHPQGAEWTAFARLDQIVPEIPAGTDLVVAGGFGNAADFFAALGTPPSGVEEIPTGSQLQSLGMGIAPYNPDGTGFVRVKVYVRTGALRGRTGWIPVGFTGIPDPGGDPANTAERACHCRVVEFR